MLLLIAMTLGAWWTIQRNQESPGPVLSLRRSKARIGTVERVLRVTGITAAARFEYLMAPRLRGTRTGRGANDLSLTLEYLVGSGLHIRKGDRAAEFDREAMRQRVDDLRASIIQQEATMRRMNSNLALKREQLVQRLRRAQATVDKAGLDLKSAPVRSAMQIERYQMALQEAKAVYQQTLLEVPYAEASEKALVRREEIDMIQAKRELDKAEQNLGSMLYHAPIDGIVVLKRISRGGAEYMEVQPGDVIGPGLAFGEIVDTNSILVNATLNQTDAEQVSYGLNARVHFDAYPDIELPGRLTAIGAMTRPGGQRAQYVREVPVRLDLDATEARVIPNLSVNADIILESAPDVVVLPKECVFRDGQKAFAMVETEEGWEKRQLELGLENNLEVAVRAGVKDGETVAAEPVTVQAVAAPVR